MFKHRRNFLPLLILLWPVAWLLVWQYALIGALEPASRPGFDVFSYGVRMLWLAVGLSFGLLILALALIVSGNAVRTESDDTTYGDMLSAPATKCGYTVATIGLIVGLVALALPVFLPRVQSLVLDQTEGAVAVRTRTLYGESSVSIDYADIDRIQHRKWSVWGGGTCIGYVSLRVIANDHTLINIPRGLTTAAMAKTIAEAANASPQQIENINTTSCPPT